MAIGGGAVVKLTVVNGKMESQIMSYADMAAILLGVLTIVLAILVPLAGIFAFVVSRNQALEKAKECIEDAMKENGVLIKTVQELIDRQFQDEQGVIRTYIKTVMEKQAADNPPDKPAADKPAQSVSFEFENDEYGDPPRKGPA